MFNRKYENVYEKLKKKIKKLIQFQRGILDNFFIKSELLEHFEYKNIISDFMPKKVIRMK